MLCLGETSDGGRSMTIICIERAKHIAFDVRDCFHLITLRIRVTRTCRSFDVDFSRSQHYRHNETKVIASNGICHFWSNVMCSVRRERWWVEGNSSLQFHGETKRMVRLNARAMQSNAAGDVAVSGDLCAIKSKIQTFISVSTGNHSKKFELLQLVRVFPFGCIKRIKNCESHNLPIFLWRPSSQQSRRTAFYFSEHFFGFLSKRSCEHEHTFFFALKSLKSLKSSKFSAFDRCK